MTLKTLSLEPPMRWLRRLDALPAGWAWGVGIGVGVLAGALLAGAAPVWVGAAGVVVLLAGAAALAASGEPVALPELAESEPTVPPLVELVAIPGGTFRMGSPEAEEGRDKQEGPVHEVRISPFECMRVPVTRRVYAEVMGKVPSEPKGSFDERPVNATWFDAVRFCNRLSEREGFRPCYRIKREKVSWDVAANGYRMLTEAEWEYACRAGSQGRWSFGDDGSRLGQYAWFEENAGGAPHPVASLEPNAFGLHDMHGNVWEWCWDRYGVYSEGAEVDPIGPDQGSYRVLRGGSFAVPPRILRSAVRGRFGPAVRGRFVGFRCGRGSRLSLTVPGNTPD